MSGKICSFSGHREVLDIDVEKRVKEEIEKLIERGFTEFYSGGMGEFDEICEKAVRRIQSKNAAVKLYLILPYMKKSVNDNRAYYENMYDEIIVPELGDIHRKRAITARNRWIAERSDAILAYVTRGLGGAHDMCNYAEKIGKEIIFVL